MKKAVIFDMDGLMIDSERMTYEGYKRECKKRGYEMDIIFYKSLMGYPVKVIKRKLTEHFGEDFPVEEVITAVHEHMELIFMTRGVPVKPGLIELLTYIQNEEYRAMVATSSDRERVDRILKYAGLEDYFDEVICGDEVCLGKPNPDIFLKGLQKLGVSPEEAYVLEDSEKGILAAYRAGIDVICVPDMKEPEEEYRKMAFCVADSLLDVKKLMELKDKSDIDTECRRKTELTFHHACIVASDYRKAVTFYVDCLGFEIYRESYSSHRNAKKMELYNNGRYVIELFVEDAERAITEAESGKNTAVGLEHISFLTEDVAGMLQSLAEKNVPVSEVKEDISTGKKYGFCWDPNGTKIEFYER